MSDVWTERDAEGVLVLAFNPALGRAVQRVPFGWACYVEVTPPTVAEDGTWRPTGGRWVGLGHQADATAFLEGEPATLAIERGATMTIDVEAVNG